MTTSGLGLSIAVLAFGASTIYLAVQLSKERDYSEQLASETRALNDRIAALEKARATPPPLVSGVFSAVSVPPGKSVSALPPPATASVEARTDRTESVVVNGPGMPMGGDAFRKMMRAQMRAQNKQMYADVGTYLGLSKEDTTKFIDLITDQQADGITMWRDNNDPAENARKANEARRAYDAKIAEHLGPEKLKLLEQYQQTIPVRQEVEALSQQLAGSDASQLSDDQRKRLLAALLEERKINPAPDYRRGITGEDYKTTYLNWQDDYNARVAAQFRGILDSEQYAAYTEYQKWQKEMNEQMRRAAPTPAGNVMYSTAAPGTIVGEIAIVTGPDEAAKEP